MASKQNKADLKAHYAKAWASATGQTPMLVGRPSDMPGWSIYQVGDVIVGMPTLLPTAPQSIKRRYLTRIICNATGTCPACKATAGDPETSEPIPQAQVEHEINCPISGDAGIQERWFDPASKPMRQALQ